MKAMNAVNICEGKGLHLLKHFFPHAGCKPGGAFYREIGTEHTGGQHGRRNQEHIDAVLKNIGNIAFCRTVINGIGINKKDNEFSTGLQCRDMLSPLKSY